MQKVLQYLLLIIQIYKITCYNYVPALLTTCPGIKAFSITLVNNIGGSAFTDSSGVDVMVPYPAGITFTATPKLTLAITRYEGKYFGIFSQQWYDQCLCIYVCENCGFDCHSVQVIPSAWVFALGDNLSCHHPHRKLPVPFQFAQWFHLSRRSICDLVDNFHFHGKLYLSCI